VSALVRGDRGHEGEPTREQVDQVVHGRPRTRRAEPALAQYAQLGLAARQPGVEAQAEFGRTGRGDPIHLSVDGGLAAHGLPVACELRALEAVGDDRIDPTACQQVGQRTVVVHGRDARVLERRLRPALEDAPTVHGYVARGGRTDHTGAADRDRARHPPVHRAVGAPGHTAHGDVEIIRAHTLLKLGPAKRHPLDAHAPVAREQGGNVDIEALAVLREGRVVAAGPDAQHIGPGRGGKGECERQRDPAQGHRGIMQQPPAAREAFG